MKIIEYKKDGVFPLLSPSAVALGLFDGVHSGHREIIKGAVKSASEKGLVPTVFTFSSESEGLKPASPRIYSTREKLEIFSTLGIEAAVVAKYEEMKDVSAEDFVTRVLCLQLNCREAHCGYNFRFGKGAKGDAALLESLIKTSCGRAVIAPEMRFEGEPLSATAIREIMSRGEVERANLMLAMPYFHRCTVTRGRGVGRTWGFPTLNTPLPEGCPLKRGVYLTRVTLGEGRLIGVTNVGVCPTVGERKAHSETFLVDFDSSIYGEEVKIEFLSLIREERKFPSVESLREQIEKDCLEARRRYASGGFGIKY